MKTITKIGAFGALLFATAGADATAIKAHYTVNTNQDDPGLVVKAEDVAANPLNLNLQAGQSTTLSLFNLYTNEKHVNHDDQQPRDISVKFDFSAPENGRATADGQTVGKKKVFGFLQKGHVHWTDPAEFSFGPNHDGLIKIALADADFNSASIWTAFHDLTPGKRFGAVIDATVRLLRDATPAKPTDVPEPSATGLFTLALAGMGLVAYRRRKSVV